MSEELRGVQWFSYYLPRGVEAVSNRVPLKSLHVFVGLRYVSIPAETLLRIIFISVLAARTALISTYYLGKVPYVVNVAGTCMTRGDVGRSHP